LIYCTNEDLARQVQIKDDKLNVRELENQELRDFVHNLSKEYQSLHDHSVECQNEYPKNEGA
jgi:hypothetical protein